MQTFDYVNTSKKNDAGFEEHIEEKEYTEQTLLDINQEHIDKEIDLQETLKPEENEIINEEPPSEEELEEKPYICSRCNCRVENLFQMNVCKGCLTLDFQRLITVINSIRR